MNNIYDLNSIFSAIEDINSKQKKKSTPLIPDNVNKRSSLIPDNVSKSTSLIPGNVNKSKVYELGNEDVLPITEKLILEAEEHSKKLTKNSSPPLVINEDILILNKEYHVSNLENFNLEEIKQSVINDLYSSLSKKVKKNTLKTIFDLHKQINELKKKIEILQINNLDNDSSQYSNSIKTNQNNTDLDDEDILKLNEEYLVNEDNFELEKEHLINEDNFELENEHLINEDNFELENEHSINEHNLELEKEHLINEKENSLSQDTIKTLKYQNSLIKKFEINEEKLRFNIIDLEQDITLLRKKNDLGDLTLKVKNKSIFYKENYERLIIENNEVNKKLINAKKQIVVFEQNITELEEGFENLNNILSKNSIIKLNDPIIKNPSDHVSLEEKSQKSKSLLIKNLDKNKK